MREGLWRTKKGGPAKSQNNPTNPKKSKRITTNPKMSKNGIWEVGEAVRNGVQAILPW